MKKNPDIREFERLLKKAVQKGEMKADFTDDDVEFLLSRSTKVRPSKEITNELEVLLIQAMAEKKSGVLVSEKPASYLSATITAGEALREMFHANGWGNDDAANRLGVSPVTVEKLLEEAMPLTAGTVRGVADSLAGKHRLPNAARDNLTQWLLNGLHFIQLGKAKGQQGSMRSAARKKRKPGKKK